MKRITTAAVAAVGVAALAPSGAAASPPTYCVPPVNARAAATQDASLATAALAAYHPGTLATKSSIVVPVVASGPSLTGEVVAANVNGRLVVVGTGGASESAAGCSTLTINLTPRGRQSLAVVKHGSSIKLSDTAGVLTRHQGVGLATATATLTQ
jgi:hypothetical protein